MMHFARVVLVAFAALRLFAQLPLTPEAEREFRGIFEEPKHPPPLACHIETTKPFLDFSFRYEIGYLARCPLKLFEGKPATVGSVLRVQPEQGKASILGQSFDVPGMPDTARARVDLHRLRQSIEFSGVFAAGEGEYDIDLAVMDDRNRVCRKSWHVAAYARGNETQAAAAMPPGAVSAMTLPKWDGLSGDGAGRRLTVLLDAAPINPYGRRLRIWDQAFLLGALSSLLREMPLASVRLVAFNLDQQRIVFRDDDFDRTGMYKLAAALQKVELGSISYTVLKREEGWSEMLAALVNTECNRAQRSDAVVFLGPDERFDRGVDLTTSAAEGDRGADISFFYLKYYPRLGADFPDAIQRLTSARNGTTFKLHSPGDLAQALVGLQRKLEAVSAQNLGPRVGGAK